MLGEKKNEKQPDLESENVAFENSVLNQNFANKKPRSLSDTMIEIQEREERLKNQ